MLGTSTSPRRRGCCAHCRSQGQRAVKESRLRPGQLTGDGALGRTLQEQGTPQDERGAGAPAQQGASRDRRRTKEEENGAQDAKAQTVGRTVKRLQ